MSAPSPLLSPRDRRLDEIIGMLATRGDDRAIIQLVETWAISGSPTRRSKLHQARAFFNLRLMDRAMARTREVTEVNPDDAEGQRLLAEIYLDRGWPSHARKLIAQLQSNITTPDPSLEALAARAHAEPSRIASVAREIEASGDPPQLLALAEHFLTTGSFFRARSILERLRRADPESRRVQDLVWALDGTFTSRDMNIDKLLAYIEGRLAEQTAGIPAPEAPVEASTVVPLGAEEPAEAQVLAGPTNLAVRILTGPFAEGTLGDNSGDIPEEPEHTESARVNEMIPEESVSFPSLFKGDSRGARSTGKQAVPLEEQTSVSQIAGAREGHGDETDPGIQGSPNLAINPSGGDDTQIMLVLRPGEQAKPGWQQGKPLHKGAEPSRELNLREWQQSMGVSPANLAGNLNNASSGVGNSSGGASDSGASQDLDQDAYQRDGDENIVLLQRPSPVSHDPEPTGSRSRPIEVIEKVPVPLIRPAVDDEPSGLVEEEDPSPDEPGPEESGDRSPNFVRLVAVVLVLMFGIMAALIFAIFYFKLI